MKWYEQILVLIAAFFTVIGGISLFIMEMLAWSHNKSIFDKIFRKKNRKSK